MCFIPSLTPARKLQTLLAVFLAIASSGCSKQGEANINAKSPGYLPASVGLMKIFCAERNNEDCDARTRTVLARNTMNYDGFGIRNIEKGDASKAVRELEYLSSIYTRNAPVRYQLARA